MDKATARHGLSMLRKIAVYTESMTNITQIDDIGLKDFEGLSSDWFLEKFEQLQQRWDQIQQVIRDMQPDLLEMDREAKNGKD